MASTPRAALCKPCIDGLETGHFRLSDCAWLWIAPSAKIGDQFNGSSLEADEAVFWAYLLGNEYLFRR